MKIMCRPIAAKNAPVMEIRDNIVILIKRGKSRLLKLGLINLKIEVIFWIKLSVRVTG